MLRLAYYICAFCIFVGVNLSAQQVPVFQQSAFLPQLDNPARYGEGFLALNYRQQWTDLGDDAPTSLRVQFDASSLLGQDRIGLGFGFLSDQAHIVKRNQVGLSFAYTLLPKTDHHLALGANLGYLSQRLSFGDKTTLNDGADLALLTGEGNQGVLDGGFGLFYQYNVADEHIYSLDLTLPQLFAGDLNYELDAGTALTELLPHLLARFSYQYQGNSFSLEPIAVYRHFLSGVQGKSGSIDASLRFGFLHDRFWASVGSRFGAATAHFSFGVKPLNGNDLQVSASLETHEQFGQSFEFGLIYPMGVKKDDPVADRKNSPSKNRRLISSTREALEEIIANGREKIQEGQSRLAGLTPQTEEIIRRERLVFAKNKLAEAQLEAKNFRRKNNELAGLPGSDTDEAVTDALLANQQLLEQYNQELYEYEEQIRALEAVTTIATLIKTGEDEKLQTMLQQSLDNAENLPETMEAVAVSRNEGDLNIKYRFSNDEEAYVLNEEGLALVANLVNHINDKIQELSRSAINISGIRVQAKMSSPPQRWRLFSAGTYNGEYGRIPSLSWQVTNLESNTIQQETVTILAGEIKLEKLVALKLYGIGQKLQSKFFNIPLSYLIEGPVEQDSGQYYEVDIVIKE